MSRAELHERYLDDVHRYVRAFLKPSDAEDVTMEVFYAAFKSFHEGIAHPRPWLLGIARRKTADCLRRLYGRKEVPLSHADASSTGDLKGSDDQIVLASLLRRLPSPYAEVITLKYVNEMAIDEIAQTLRKSPQATNSLLHRARAALLELGAGHDLQDRSQA